MGKKIKNIEPLIVSVKDFNIDSDYVAWFTEIKQRYRAAQIKAAYKINAEKLRFNWSIGRDLVIRKAEERWGTWVVEQLSFDLQNAFPQDKGFSTSNLWSMKKWYLFFSKTQAFEKLHQLGGELSKQVTLSNIAVSDESMVDGFPQVLGLIPWRHQVEIITKCKSIDAAIFYIK